MDNEDDVWQQGEQWQRTRILMSESNGGRFHTQQSNERKIDNDDIATTTMMMMSTNDDV